MCVKMEYLVTQAEMKQYDNNTITRLKMPSLVLMERAALITVEQIRKERGDGAYRVLVVAGCGNNGGDGFAIGRILLLQGCQVDFVLGNFSSEDRELLKERIPVAVDAIREYILAGIGSAMCKYNNK